MEITYEVTETDHRYAQKLSTKRLGKLLNRRWSVRIPLWFWSICFGFFLISGFKVWDRLCGKDETYFAWVFLSGVATVVGIIVWLVLNQRAHRSLEIAAFTPFPVTERLIADENGIAISSPRVNLEIRWSEVHGINKDHEYLVLELFHYYVGLVPLNAFENAESADEFCRYVNERSHA